MQIKIKRSVLVGDADIFPRPAGTVVEVDDVKGREFIAAGLADQVSEGGQKMAAATESKRANIPANKAIKRAPSNKATGPQDNKGAADGEPDAASAAADTATEGEGTAAADAASAEPAAGEPGDKAAATA